MASLTTSFDHFWAANAVMVGTDGFELGTADVGPDIEPRHERGQRGKRFSTVLCLCLCVI